MCVCVDSCSYIYILYHIFHNKSSGSTKLLCVLSGGSRHLFMVTPLSERVGCVVSYNFMLYIEGEREREREREKIMMLLPITMLSRLSDYAPGGFLLYILLK